MDYPEENEEDEREDIGDDSFDIEDYNLDYDDD